MRESFSRRSFLTGLPALAAVIAAPSRVLHQPPPAGVQPDAPVDEAFPRTQPDVVGRFVAAAHTDLDEVRRLVERQPSLARSSWDWGFGDWETGLGAAAHMGRRDIADVLLTHGARPTIFSAAMMGELDVVKAFVSASPGIQRTPGPHGITLMAHARAGGVPAESVVRYLEGVGEADVKPQAVPLEDGDREAIVGRYVFGAGPRDRFDVDVRNNQVGIQRPGTTRRVLVHRGAGVFFPSGVPSVKISFLKTGLQASQLTIADPEVLVVALRA